MQAHIAANIKSLIGLLLLLIIIIIIIITIIIINSKIVIIIVCMGLTITICYLSIYIWWCS